MNKKFRFFAVGLLLPSLILAQSAWKPVPGLLTTPWTEKVTPANVHKEYPRPQMVRDNWKNLNGLWDYSILPILEKQPAKWDGKILVPFPVESNLSGVKKRVGPDSTLWYKRIFTVPPGWKNQRILLHFEAVDWETIVWVNGKEMGNHQGGYDDFTFDITDALKPAGEQEIVVSVWDPSDAGYQPAGKQWNKPRGIWYTPTTGIWQTVWMEPVPKISINDFKLIPDISTQTLHLLVPSNKAVQGYSIEAIAYNKGVQVSSVSGIFNDTLHLKLKEMKLWSPSSPFLYDLSINLYNNGKKTDAVKSYFGMREIRVGADKEGVTRLLLNNEPLFQLGPLDQGFWPDGLYTAPTDEALKYDIEVEKNIGYNMIRKHVKVEPKRWYYWCDKMGMLVWQDMPNGDKHIRQTEPDIVRTAQSSYQYRKELKEMIDEHFNSPSIVTWVPFNEGWGQFETAGIVSLVRKLDNTRTISATSGWSDRNVGDMHDIHVYPGPEMPAAETDRAAVLGEFGGQAWVVPNHLWQADLSRAPTHIRTSQTSEDLQKVYEGLIEKLAGLKKKGLSAAVYTQTTDVETEVNGIMTYDRKLIKMNVEKLKKIHTRVINQ
jgi:beta-galactosidase/beta-glucuronidase